MGAMNPEQIKALKADLLPKAVFDVWNKLIARNLDTTGRATVMQEEAVQALLPLVPEGAGRQFIFDSKWLDIEAAYRQAGWRVEYDKSFAYAGETGDNSFLFVEPS